MGAAISVLPRRVNDRERDTERAGLPMLFKTTLPLRFWSKVYADDYGCWLWTATCSPGGYGRYWLRGTTWAQAHRESYTALTGAIPDGLTIDHLCRVRICVNPRHMEPVTQRVNTLRGVSPAAIHARQTHCKRGHEFTAENIIRRQHGRACRICLREQQDRYVRSEKGRATRRARYQRRRGLVSSL